jgi:hypothetical protein
MACRPGPSIVKDWNKEREEEVRKIEEKEEALRRFLMDKDNTNQQG